MNVLFNHIYDKTTILEQKFMELLESLKFDGQMPVPVFEFCHNLNKVQENE